MVVMLDTCLDHQGASLEQMCSPVWKGELCYIPCKGRGERGKAEGFFISLLPSPPQNPKAWSPWKPGQLFLLAEGLSPDWNDSFELEDIISLAC